MTLLLLPMMMMGRRSRTRGCGCGCVCVLGGLPSEVCVWWMMQEGGALDSLPV